jgi:hypothetical protein
MEANLCILCAQFGAGMEWEEARLGSRRHAKKVNCGCKTHNNETCVEEGPALSNISRLLLVRRGYVRSWIDGVYAIYIWFAIGFPFFRYAVRRPSVSHILFIRLLSKGGVVVWTLMSGQFLLSSRLRRYLTPALVSCVGSG